MILGNSWSESRATVHSDWGHVGFGTSSCSVGFRVLKQFDGEPLPGMLDRPLVLRPGLPLSVRGLVQRPEKIPGLQSWSIELAGPHTIVANTAIAANPNSGLVALGSQGGKISLWDRDGNYQRALLGHEGWVLSLDFSSDGRWLASCELISGDRGHGGNTARVWNVETGAVHAVIPIPTWSHRIKFSPNGEQLAVNVFDQYRPSFVVVDLTTGSSRMPANLGGGLGLAWSPDGMELACSHNDGHLRVWDAKTLKVLRDVDAPLSQPLEWSPDGQWLALRNAEGQLAIRDAKTLELKQMAKASNIDDSSHSIAWLPDSRRLLVAQSGVASGVLDATTGEQLAKFEHSSYAIALLENGKQAVYESGGRLFFHDTSTGQKLREGKERGGMGHVPATLVENGQVVFAIRAQQVFAHDAARGELLRRFTVPFSSAILPSPDGTLLAVRLSTPSMQIVDAKDGAAQHAFSHERENVTSLTWSPDGKWLATGATDKLVRVWNVATGKIEHEFAGHAGTIWSLAWSPDGTRLASAAEDKTVRLWNPLTGKLVATYDLFPEAMIGHHEKYDALAWTTDSRRLWIALTNNIVPLDVETGTFGPLENFGNGGAPTFLNTSPDGQRLLTREGYGWTFVRGRDAQDRRLLGQRLGEQAQWHPDSRRFLGWELGYGTVGFDVETNRRLGLLFPWLTGDHWLCLGPTGHYRGSPGVEDQFVYVALFPDGSQRTYTPAEFAKQFNWKNDPEKAELLGK